MGLGGIHPPRHFEQVPTGWNARPRGARRLPGEARSLIVEFQSARPRGARLLLAKDFIPKGKMSIFREPLLLYGGPKAEALFRDVKDLQSQWFALSANPPL